MTKVLVLGVRGMLGSMVARVLGQRRGLEVTTTSRGDGLAVPNDLPHRRFDVLHDPIEPLLDSGHYDWIINTVGVTKPRIDERVAASIEHAVAVNALFPHRLAAAGANRGQRVIQIATDGVFSGARGPYGESAPHDALDVYGRTKSLGEVPASNVQHLRCSIIGPERPPASSLLGWILSSSTGTELRGYTDHHWNGVTTLHFAKLCAAVIAGVEVPLSQHVIPGDTVSKAELLELVLSTFGRHDVTVRPVSGSERVDRTLTTREPEANQRLWRAAGHHTPPTIEEMLRDLAAYEAGDTDWAA